MNRRGFFTKLLGSVLAVKAGKVAAEKAPKSLPFMVTVTEGGSGWVSYEWVSYRNLDGKCKFVRADREALNKKECDE